jgi:hypothetical protein
MSRDGFFERWSRRKLSEGEADEPQVPAEAEAAPETGPDEPDEEVLDEAELDKLPSLDAFTVKTDLAPFLRKGVPPALKNAAMRRMWMLDPAVRDHVDCAVDYAWDWNTPGGVAGNAGTISQDSLARMMDGINPKPKDKPEAEETVAGAPDEAAQSAVPEAQAEVPQEPVEADPPETPEESRRQPRPRRHGGAAPV